MTNFEITTTTGRKVRRSSDANYVAAAETKRGEVTFHKTIEAARKKAGPYGTVHPISDQPSDPAECFVCEGEGGWSEQRADGSRHDVVCFRCHGTGVKPS